MLGIYLFIRCMRNYWFKHWLFILWVTKRGTKISRKIDTGQRIGTRRRRKSVSKKRKGRRTGREVIHQSQTRAVRRGVLPQAVTFQSLVRGTSTRRKTRVRRLRKRRSLRRNHLPRSSLSPLAISPTTSQQSPPPSLLPSQGLEAWLFQQCRLLPHPLPILLQRLSLSPRTPIFSSCFQDCRMGVCFGQRQYFQESTFEMRCKIGCWWRWLRKWSSVQRNSSTRKAVPS